MAGYVRYTDEVEVKKPDEEAVFDEITATMRDISKKVGERQRHATRSVHAESQGLLKAEFTVVEGLPAELRQGLSLESTRAPVQVLMIDHVEVPSAN